MLTCGMRRRRKSLHSAYLWVVVMVVVSAAREGEAEVEPIYRSSPLCSTTRSSLDCSLPYNPKKTYQLEHFKWENTRKVVIHGNGNTLFLKEQTCDTKPVVEVYNASAVTTVNSKGPGCAMDLTLHDCRNANIVNNVNRLSMMSSKANKVILPQVSQFNLQSSWVGEVSLKINQSHSKWENSTIDVVTRLEVSGSFNLEISNCEMGRILNASFTTLQTSGSVLKNVTIGTVATEGITLHNGVLTLSNCSMTTIASNGIVVKPIGHLILKQSDIQNYDPNSILLLQGGKIQFQDITLHQTPNISFTLSEGSLDLYPLAFMKISCDATTFTVWIVVAVIFGLVVGAGTVIAALCVLKRWGPGVFDKMDVNILLSEESSSPQTRVNPPTDNQTTKALPKPPIRPLPSLPGTDLYEEYSDVMNPIAQNQEPPKNEIDQKSPYVPARKDFPTTGQPPAKLACSFQLKSQVDNSNNDDHDCLPPPPSPDREDVYDQVECTIFPSPPAPPPSTNKPKPLLPPSTKKSNISFLQRPPAPPSTKKPNRV